MLKFQSKQDAKDRICNEASRSQTNAYLVDITNHVQSSTTKLETSFSTRLTQLEKTSGQHTDKISAKVEESIQLTATMLHEQLCGFLGVLKDSLTAGLQDQTQLWQRTMLDLQKQIDSIKKSTPETDKSHTTDPDDWFEQCVERLYDITKSTSGDSSVESLEARAIIEDIICVITTLLNSINSSNLQKLNNGENRGATTTQISVGESRIVARMKGLLESSQSLEVRTSCKL